MVNLTDVTKQSQIRDRLLLRQMEKELKREIITVKRAVIAKQKVLEEKEDEGAKIDQKKPVITEPPPAEDETPNLSKKNSHVSSDLPNDKHPSEDHLPTEDGVGDDEEGLDDQQLYWRPLRSNEIRKRYFLKVAKEYNL